MYIISAVICFIAIGIQETDLCFKSQVPVVYQTKEECVLNMNKVADYMTADLTERNSAIYFRCIEVPNNKKETLTL